MTQLNARKVRSNEAPNKNYSSFLKLNGEHPLKNAAPRTYVAYQARKKKGGKVTFFNFELAKEMGLIPRTHKNELNAELEQMILDTFSLVIINEYDIENNIKFSKDEILPHTYMATRYLQLQHPDKTGRTSGDGRSVWNGVVRNNGTTWDVTSCGTGATKLSPATNIQKKFFQTGDPSISYGCGLSEVSEGFETLFFSEIFHQNKINTERILAIIEYEKGLAINVRANQNLLRPSHFFCHLKQSNLQTLKELTDYYIDREIKNGVFQDVSSKSPKERYSYMLDKVAENFAQTVARFEDDYIFCWLDWDGDNILMDGGIIDYGSIRQFGLFHSEYRYDDIQRYSTSILEQKQKAKYIVQSFAQIADYLITKKKKPLSHFRNAPILSKFEATFLNAKNRNFLTKLGCINKYADFLINNHMTLVRNFRKTFTYFERQKSKRGIYKVEDGITQDAVFCMRDILRELPQLYLTRDQKITPDEFLQIMASSYAGVEDLVLTTKKKQNVDLFQKYYLEVIELLANNFKKDSKKVLLEMNMRSSVINKYERVTGDSIYFIVEKLKKSRPKLKYDELYRLLVNFRNYQNLDPDYIPQSMEAPQGRPYQMLSGIHSIVRECREGI